MPISYSVYPNLLDGYSTLPLRTDGVHEIVAADHNMLRDAIIKIEYELGVQPSGTYATVRERLNNIGSAYALISGHLTDTTDAHDASAISILDSSDNYVSLEVEGALIELAAVLPAALDTIGNDNTTIPNSGVPDFVTFAGTRFGWNAGSANPLNQTQPVLVTGIHIIDIGDENGNGAARLQLSTAGNVRWEAPGDAFGAEVSVSALSTGDIATLSSNDTTKQIRIARTSAALPAPVATDTLIIQRLDAATGAVSVTGTGILDTNYVTRTAWEPLAQSRDQFVISGIVYPADKGTLVLQRKLRNSADFAAIAVLDLGDNFSESLRDTTQPVYVPALTNYDTITLFDRLPAKMDYEDLDADASGDQVYANLDISATFSGFQYAKYIIPVSNSGLVGGDLNAPTDITAAEMNGKVSTYRIVHYKTGITDFNGEPAEADIFSMSDPLADASDGDNNVRMANVVVDSDLSRPRVVRAILRPDAPEAENITKYVSGVNYYNGTGDLFHLEVESDTDLFANAYARTGILTFGTDVFSFPLGRSIDVTLLRDHWVDGYNLFSDTNLPDFNDEAFYLINDLYNTSGILFPEINKFSTNAWVGSTFHDPFGPGDTFDSYGFVSSSEEAVRILVNSYPRYRATPLIEYFTDESFRVSRDEIFNFNLDKDQFTYHFGPSDGYQLYMWNEESVLLTGDLQCGGRFGINDFYIPGLILPQSDYSSGIAPVQENAPNYSTDAYGQADESIYQRLFNLGETINRFRLRVESGGNSLISFNDIYHGNSDRCIKISVKIPGTGSNSTGWLDCGRLFETGKYEDNSGCLYGSIGGSTGNFVIPITLGVRNNANTGGMIAVRISYLGPQSDTAKLKIMTRLTIMEAE